MEERYWNLLNKHAANDLTSSEQRELQQWLDKDPERAGLAGDFKKINQFVDQRRPPYIDVDDAWLRMQNALTEKPVTAPRKLGFVQLLARAAIIVGIGSAAFFTYVTVKKPVTVSVATLSNTRREIRLPDQSYIYLKENSAFVYPKSFVNGEEKRVALKGRAFIIVNNEDKRQFVLEAGGCEIYVAGQASFALNAVENDKVSIDVVDGEITFGLKETAKTALRQGQVGILAASGKVTVQRSKNPPPSRAMLINN